MQTVPRGRRKGLGQLPSRVLQARSGKERTLPALSFRLTLPYTEASRAGSPPNPEAGPEPGAESRAAAHRAAAYAARSHAAHKAAWRSPPARQGSAPRPPLPAPARPPPAGPLAPGAPPWPAVTGPHERRLKAERPRPPLLCEAEPGRRRRSLGPARPLPGAAFPGRAEPCLQQERCSQRASVARQH